MGSAEDEGAGGGEDLSDEDEGGSKGLEVMSDEDEGGGEVERTERSWKDCTGVGGVGFTGRLSC